MRALLTVTTARKRLTIGVELASKPELLLFLDEPASGLESQSAWNLVRFLRKLADAGQAILCTIHQPSALPFESFGARDSGLFTRFLTVHPDRLCCSNVETAPSISER